MYTYNKFPHKDSNLWVVYKNNHPFKVVKSEAHAKLLTNNLI
jgi:hypothetical protein